MREGPEISTTTKRGDPIQRQSLADEVASRLRQQIIGGALEPKTRLIVENLAADFGVSPIPVREALARIESEGLADRLPTKGLVVAEIRIDEIRELYQLRAWIEPKAVAQALACMTHADADRIRQLYAALAEATKGGTWGPGSWELHDQFHRAVVSPGLGQWTTRMLDLIYLNIDRYKRFFIALVHVGEAMADHAALAEACYRRDAAAAEDIMLQHIIHIEQRAVRVLRLLD